MTSTEKLAPDQAFAVALAAFQAQLPHVGKAQTAQTGSYSYDYADLTGVTEAAMPLLAKHGLSFTATPMLSENGFVLRYALIHQAGHREGGDYPLPDPTKSSPQQIGSAVTYARRYCLTAVTGIAPGGSDDDGAQAEAARAAAPRSHRPNRNSPSLGENDPHAIRAQIAILAAERGLSRDAVADDFAQREGCRIQDGTPEQLAAFLKLLRDGEMTPA